MDCAWIKPQRDRFPPRPARAVIDSITFESRQEHWSATPMYMVYYASPFMKANELAGHGGGREDERRDEPVDIRTDKKKRTHNRYLV